jgi:two-component sensor histidine kinase
VAAVANIQRRLYETEGALISFERIVTGLASDMAEVNDARITCFVSPDLGSPPPGAAGPLTLVLQELIANAVEHGRVPGRKLEVVVSLRRHNLHLARLVVEDNGPGLPAHFHEDTSLGLKLVRVLASQIGSDFRLQNRPDGHAGAVASLMVVLASASEDSGSQEPAAAELTSSSAAPA